MPHAVSKIRYVKRGDRDTQMQLPDLESQNSGGTVDVALLP